MTCQRIQESFTDALSGSLPAAEAATLQNHLDGCAECRREWATLQQTLVTLDRLPAAEPSPRVRARFDAMLAQAKREADKTAVPANPFSRGMSRLDTFLAALLPGRPAFQAAFTVAVLAVGLLIGFQLRPASAPPAATAPDPELVREIAALRTEVASMGQLVSASLLQPSANARLAGVLAATEAGTSDEASLARLLQTLAFDSSTNVRLVALERLYAHADRERVRAAVLAALPRETSPLVQVAMIDFLAAVREPAASPVLADLARTGTVDEAVRSAARTALALL
jgi:hypothetical protein